LHVVERYRLIDHEAAKQAQDRAGTQFYRLPRAAEGWSPDPAYKKGLQLEFAVEDEGVYTMSWSAIMTYRRMEIFEGRTLVFDRKWHCKARIIGQSNQHFGAVGATGGSSVWRGQFKSIGVPKP
jgi:hypothetical protein